MTLDEELTQLIERYTDYCECEEYHIHQNSDGIEPNADKNDGHMEFDEDKFKARLTALIEREKVDGKIEELTYLMPKGDGLIAGILNLRIQEIKRELTKASQGEDGRI